MTTTETKEFTLPFVGREEELKFLWNEYDQMLHAQYRSVWLEAPAGMGKTTLVEEFLRRLQSQSMKPWIVHAHLRERSSNSLATFVEALGVKLQTLSEEQRNKLFSGLTPFYHERAKKIVGGGSVQSMDMEEAITTTGYILKQLSKYFPLVVIVEDLHVLKGEMSFHALRHLLAIVEHVPILTIFISRPSDEKYFHEFQNLVLKEGCKKYNIENLRDVDIQSLAATDDEEQVRKLLRLSGGNALLLRELLRAGSITDDKSLQNTTTENIIHLLTKELEKFPKRERQVIAIAGMLGEEFSEQLLREITSHKDFKCWTSGVVQQLENQGILRRRKKILKSEGNEKTISTVASVFAHALWWEAARRL